MINTKSSTPPPAYLDSVEGEIAFFHAITRARPVGLHRYFHILAVRNGIHRETGHFVPVEDIWEKLKTCYDLDALDAIDLDADGYYSPSSSSSTPVSIPSPSPSENLSAHPFFRDEFTLPFEEAFESLIAARRMRATASIPSSPAPSHSASGQKRGGKKRGKSKLDMAGLVGGDSDSSALTLESGDEGAPLTPRESVVTGTDGGTDYAEEDIEMREPSPAPSAASKPTRNKAKPTKKAAVAGRTRATAATTSRGSKKKKR